MFSTTYCSFKVSKLLKEYGLHEPCVRHYHIDGEMSESTNIYSDWNLSEEYVSCFTHEEVITWMRDVKGIVIVISPYIVDDSRHTLKNDEAFNWKYEALQLINGPYYRNIKSIGENTGYKVYECAVEAALEYTLTNYI